MKNSELFLTDAYDLPRKFLNKHLYKLVESENYDEFCRICHDIALVQIHYDTDYPTDLSPEDLSWYISEICYLRATSEWKYPIQNWYWYIRRNYYRYKSSYLYYYHNQVEDFYNYPDDTLLDDAIKISSGIMKPPSRKRSVSCVGVENILEIVLTYYCNYSSSTHEYASLKISLVVSIVERQVTTDFLMDMSLVLHLTYLYNIYMKIFNSEVLSDSRV